MPRASFRELMPFAREVHRGPRQIVFTGADPVFPTPYRVGTAGAAAIGAVGVLAAHSWQAFGGRGFGQQVTVDVRAAAAALRSARYLRVNGAPARQWDPLSDFYRVRDGRWIRLHCNFAHHRAAALRVLGAAEDHGAVAAACMGWDGPALEDALHDAGGCAGFVRTPAEWAAHPQAAAIAAEPLLSITKIAPSRRGGGSPLNRPLDHLRVLDLTRVLAGPTCGRALAEHGATVLRITAPHLPDSGDADYDTGLGKLSARLDLRRPSGVNRLRALLRQSDVFVQSYRPGSLAARGFAPEQLAQWRPRIIVVSLSAWGASGPWAHRRGFDSIVQAVSGMSHVQGGGGAPALMPVSAIDYVSGYLMAFGVLAAEIHQLWEGGSWLVRVSLARTAQWIVDRGQVDPAALSGVPDELPEDELAGLLTETDSAVGRIRHLKPVARLPETPAGWDRPPVPLGYDAPRWPERVRRRAHAPAPRGSS